ncbi:MAG: acylaminoacyl-peptidase [Woeseiaceae bacterium]|nr:acylaminoacyl-peptidase [Woeseiaceae bacterium]
MKKFSLCLFVLLNMTYSANSYPKDTEKQNFSSQDIHQIKDIHSLDLSPSSNFIIYLSTSTNQKKDHYESTMWLQDRKKNKTQAILKNSTSIDKPSFSPNEDYVSYLAAGKGKYSNYQQLWLINRKNLKKNQITKIKQNVTDFEWSPDGKKIVLVIQSQQSQVRGTKPPYVIDRFQFKRDGEDFLGNYYKHLHILDVKSKKITQLTTGNYDQLLPAWSPDSSRIAFTTKKGDADRHNNWDIYVTDLQSNISQLTSYVGTDADPYWGAKIKWSPDGKKIAYMRSGDPNLLWYSITGIAITDVETKRTQLITASLDRNTSFPEWGDNSDKLYFIIEDNMKSQLAVFDNTPNELCDNSTIISDNYSVEQTCDYWDSSIKIITEAKYFISNYSKAYDVENNSIALSMATAKAPNEIFILEEKKLQQLSNHNSEFLSERLLNPLESLSFSSFDGTDIHGMLIKPHNFNADQKYPLIIRIHGGPVSQYDQQFYLQWQIFAGNEYLVMAVNPRGSSGRGEDFQRTIFADWGNVDAKDIIAAVDFALTFDFVDEDKLGIGGWSYGSMLTNYVISMDQRFKAATSGAGISNILSGFGNDQYIRDYITELGLPWNETNKWLNVSDPFFNANKITTPTLFLVGEKDYNVPLIGSEQMYQALKYLSVPTQLIIYPGEHHSFSTPSYEKDVIDRYLNWYDKFLN